MTSKPFPTRFLACFLFAVLGCLVARAEEEILTKVEEAPVATLMPPPQYPPELVASKASGLVAVSAVIDENGNVISCEVVKATKDEFKQAALDAAKTWKFKPAKNGGKAVKVRVTLPVRFTPPA